MPDDLDFKNQNLGDPIREGFDVSNLPRCDHHWYRKSYSQIRCEKCPMELIDVGNIEVVDGKLKLKG